MHRYIDDIFFTSNEPLDRINQMLDEADNLHPIIKLVRQIGKSVSFLDLLIENKDGVLATSVYRKEAAEPYLVPFNSDHPQHVFTNIIDGALMRAIRYSSTLSAFDEERRSIKLLLLYDGFVLQKRLSLIFLLFFLFIIVIHHDISTIDSRSFLQTILKHLHFNLHSIIFIILNLIVLIY